MKSKFFLMILIAGFCFALPNNSFALQSDFHDKACNPDKDEPFDDTVRNPASPITSSGGGYINFHCECNWKKIPLSGGTWDCKRKPKSSLLPSELESL